MFIGYPLKLFMQAPRITLTPKLLKIDNGLQKYYPYLTGE
jgi:hypothetical protein